MKAYLDRMYLGFNQKDIKVQFFNPSSLSELVKSLREHQRQDKVDVQQLSVLSGLAWGTYSCGPGCKGDLLVTLHIELANGMGVSFQSQGKPETVCLPLRQIWCVTFSAPRFPPS